MTTTLVLLGLLALLIFLALFTGVRRWKMEPKPENFSKQMQIGEPQKDKEGMVRYSPINWEAEWRTNAWEVDKEAYKAVSKALNSRTHDMPFSALSRVQEASKDAAITVYQQAGETGAPAETARTAALAAYRNTFEAKLTDEHWLAEWRKNAWEVDGDTYRAIADMLEDEQGYISLHSPEAVDRVMNASAEAAIAAYRQASEHDQDGESSRKAALAAYRTTCDAKLTEEKERQSVPAYVHQRLNALSQVRIQQIEQRMHPDSKLGAGHGATSVSGFLQPGESLLAIIANDERTLHELGITPEQVADCLEQYVAKAKRIQDLARRGQLVGDQQIAHELAYDEREIPVDDHFSLRYTACMGTQACPFEDEAGRLCGSRLYGDADFTLRNTRTNDTLVFPGLIIHLIREHHFFEGSVEYRVEPRHAVKVLELQPGIDYRPQYKRTSVWRVNEGTAATDETAFDNFARLRTIRDDPQTMLELNQGTHLYVRGDYGVAVAESECQAPQDLMLAGAIWGACTVNAGVWGFVRSNELYVDL